MQGDKSAFSSTYGVALALAPLQAHTGHFAVRKDAVVPGDVNDDFLRDQGVFVYSTLHDVWMVVDGIMASQAQLKAGYAME